MNNMLEKSIHIESNDCPFCNIDKNKIIAETKYNYIMYDEYPVSKGHMLIIPKRHAADFGDLNADEYEDVRRCINLCRYQNDHDYHPDGYNIGVNIGEAAGQSVMHCHIHVIPRYKGDVKNPKGGVRGVIPNKQNYEVKPKVNPEILKYKYICFEYIMMGFINWYNQWNEKYPKNQIRISPKIYFTKIRCSKLLFLLSAVNESNDLLDIFNNYYPSYLGPVESDILDAMNDKKFQIINFENEEFKYKEISDSYFDKIKLEDKQKIDESFIKLKEKNFKLINYSAFDLIELTRKWASWCIYFNVFQKFGEPITIKTKDIREDFKYFKI